MMSQITLVRIGVSLVNLENIAMRCANFAQGDSNSDSISDIHGYIPRASNCLVCYAIDDILSHPYKILGFSTNMLPMSWSSS